MDRKPGHPNEIYPFFLFKFSTPLLPPFSASDLPLYFSETNWSNQKKIVPASPWQMCQMLEPSADLLLTEGEMSSFYLISPPHTPCKLSLIPVVCLRTAFTPFSSGSSVFPLFANYSHQHNYMAYYILPLKSPAPDTISSVPFSLWQNPQKCFYILSLLNFHHTSSPSICFALLTSWNHPCRGYQGL